MTAHGHLEAEGLRLSYSQQHGGRFRVLDVDRFAVAAGEAVGITGPSGAGKTSLLYVLTGIEKPDSGSVVWGGVDIGAFGEGERDRWRRQRVGFVFQDFHLLPGMTALQNVLAPIAFDSFLVPKETANRAGELLERLGAPTGRTGVNELSRGEQQRVALARALINRPDIIVADEPTASLDADSGRAVIDLLIGTARESGATLLAVTHDPAFMERLDTLHWLEGGQVSDARRRLTGAA